MKSALSLRWIVVLLSTVAAAVAGYVLSQRGHHYSGKVISGNQSWVKPEALERDADTPYKQLAKQGLWPVVRPEEKDLAPLTPSDWQLTGVYRAGERKGVLLAVQGKPLQTLFPGDTLPGGAVIAQVTDAAVQIKLNGRISQIGLHRE
ncbi:hypothetical protein KSF73_03290 [Burkholderiaceae bacterium DAT-1]|nr:hypothetical protein [Burkholderiaceae bacterium DAT-1]